MSNRVLKTQIQEVVYKRHKFPISKSVNGALPVDDWFWVEEERAKIIFSGTATIVILQDGSKGVAKCHEDDQFNPRIGVKIAYRRAKIVSLQKEINWLRRNL